VNVVDAIYCSVGELEGYCDTYLTLRCICDDSTILYGKRIDAWMIYDRRWI
jgi:hypothetical protein